MAKNDIPEKSGFNSIVIGTEVTGDIRCKGDIRIDGILKGNLISEGKVVIGSTGKITGEITAKNIDIFGVIEGKLSIKELLSLKSSSKVLGDILTSKISIEPGCIFTGTCKMDATDNKK